MPCDIDQMCSAIISAGGRFPGGTCSISRSDAERITAKARSPAAVSSGLAFERNAGFEHRRIVRRLGAREGQIGPAGALERRHRVGPAAIPRGFQRGGELLEAAPRDVGEQLVAVAEMAVRRGRADAGPARRIGKGEPRRPFLGDQLERGADQRFLEVAVVIAARTFRPAHVKGVYMTLESAST